MTSRLAIGFWAALLLMLQHSGCQKDPKEALRQELIDRMVSNDANMVSQLLDDHPHLLKVTNDRGSNLFQMAIVGGKPDILEVLLERNISMEARIGRVTAFHYAAEYGPTRAVELLIAHGMDVDITTGMGNTPLHFAGMTSFRSDITEALINAGANVKAVNMFNQTPLHAVAQCCVVTDNVLEAVNLLLNAGADINAVDHFGMTVLDYSEELKQDKLTRFLKEQRAVNGPGPDPEKVESLKSLVGPSDAETLRLLQMFFTTRSGLSYQSGRNN